MLCLDEVFAAWLPGRVWLQVQHAALEQFHARGLGWKRQDQVQTVVVFCNRVLKVNGCGAAVLVLGQGTLLEVDFEHLEYLVWRVGARARFAAVLVAQDQSVMLEGLGRPALGLSAALFELAAVLVCWRPERPLDVYCLFYRAWLRLRRQRSSQKPDQSCTKKTKSTGDFDSLLAQFARLGPWLAALKDNGRGKDSGYHRFGAAVCCEGKVRPPLVLGPWQRALAAAEWQAVSLLGLPERPARLIFGQL